jgi:hypothetical protein
MILCVNVQIEDKVEATFKKQLLGGKLSRLTLFVFFLLICNLCAQVPCLTTLSIDRCCS